MFKLLKTFMKADGAFVNVFDPRGRQIVFVAHCLKDGEEASLYKVPSPEKLSPLKIENVVFLCPDIREDRFTQKVLSECLPEVRSFLMMSLDQNERHLGVVCFYSNDKDHFSDEQRVFLSHLHDPFALMTSNALNSILFDNYRILLHENHGLADSVRESRLTPLRSFCRNTPALRSVGERIEQISRTEVPVLILGETGSGKEVLVDLLQKLSNRKDGPFVKINCGAIPETLIDAEFFGHEKGAFTDAKTQKKGIFEQASGGTLFLDEIGELSLSAQVRLLRVLQQKVVTRVGGTHSIPVDFRLVAATHRDLRKMAEEGAFRSDLLYRLNLFPIRVPPLRERKEDLKPLTDLFLSRISRKYGITQKLSVAPTSLIEMEQYRWPGNVRELENTLERSFLLSPNGSAIEVRFEVGSEQVAAGRSEEHVKYACETYEKMQRRYFEEVLKSVNGKISGEGGAAQITGLHPNTLRSKLEKLSVPFKGREH